MMTHIYFISGMTCGSCQAKVQSILSKITGIKNVTVDLAKGEAIIDMDKHIATSILKKALIDYPKYQLTESIPQRETVDVVSAKEPVKSWFEIYQPILLIFAYITGVTFLIEFFATAFSWMRWMNHFMAAFFLVFSFFKLLNLKGFAESYSMYDIVAKKWSSWGYVYAFAELILGILFLTGLHPLLTNAATFVLMSVSIIGVLQSVLNKRVIKCACLGDVFNLPMSTLTIIEDAVMIGMSGIMLVTML